MCWQVCSLGPVFQRHLLQLFLLVSNTERPDLSLSVSLSRFRVICVHLVPCVSLVILNILLFSAIRRAERRRQKLLASRVKAEQAGLMKG